MENGKFGNWKLETRTNEHLNIRTNEVRIFSTQNLEQTNI